MTLGAARSISEAGGGGPIPYARVAPLESGFGGATPVNPGEQSLELTVSVVFDIAGE